MGTADLRQKRNMIQAEVWQLEEEERSSSAMALGSQGAWMKWDVQKHKITWPEIWRLEPFRISFLLRSVYDTLPSPTNLHRWGLGRIHCEGCVEREEHWCTYWMQDVF